MSSLANQIQANGFAVVDGRTQRGQADRYLLEVRKGETLQMNALARKASEDIVLKLGIADGEMIARSDDYLWSSSSRITWTATRSETVEIVVKFDDTDHGKDGVAYDLYIDDLSVDDEFDRPGEGDDAFAADRDALTLASNLLKKFSGDNGILEIGEMGDLALSFVNKDGVVSADDFEVLHGIGVKLEKFVDPGYRDYYQYIYNSAVGYNRANQWWTGGESERVALGSLQIGSSRRDFNKLVKKWLYGQDSPKTVIDGDAAQGINRVQMFNYGVANGPVFEGLPTYEQVSQGTAGTCYFLAGLMDIANRHPDIFQGLFLDNGNGTYGVRFYGTDNQPVWVTVDPSSLPIDSRGGLAFSGSDSRSMFRDPLTNILWPGMLEKAYAQANEIGVFARADQTNSYRSIEYGDAAVFRYLGGEEFGFPYLGITARPNDSITGSEFVLFKNEDIVNRKMNDNDYSSILAKSLRGAMPLDVQPSDELGRRYENGSAMMLLSLKAEKMPGKIRFVKGHAYAVVDYSLDSGMFKIANPWGQNDVGLSTFDLTSDELNSLVSGGGLIPVFSQYNVL